MYNKDTKKVSKKGEKMESVRFSLRLNKEIDSKVKKKAKELECSKNKVIILACKEFLKMQKGGEGEI